MRNIIFYNFHVNGDCFTSRILVNHFLKNFKDANYYYTSHRSLTSHCLDLGISSENFNLFQLPPNAENNIVCSCDNNLFINTWIGKCSSNFCIWCLDSYINYYNSIIDYLNNSIQELNIPKISDKITPFIPFNYEFYSCEFLKTYIETIKKTYKKIILVYNNLVTTYIFANNIKYDGYINILSDKYPEYFFITFTSTTIIKNNVIDMQTIYKNNNEVLPKAYGIEFAYLNTLCDKIICSPSGLTQLGFYDEKIVKNKYAMLYCKCDDVPSNHVCDEYKSENLCIEKYGFYYKKIWILNKMQVLSEIDNFINLPIIYE
jgi:hypothetical protein